MRHPSRKQFQFDFIWDIFPTWTQKPESSTALNRAVLRVLRALIRVLVRHGVALPAFVELAKRAYVDVALNDFAIPGRKPSVSRAAPLTGLTRKETQRMVDDQGSGRQR